MLLLVTVVLLESCSGACSCIKSNVQITIFRVMQVLEYHNITILEDAHNAIGHPQNVIFQSLNVIWI